MANEFIMPFARANPSDFRKIRKRVEAKTPGFEKDILERLGDFFAGFRDGTFDDDTIYGVACDLSSAKAWELISPEKLAIVLKKANDGARSSFLDGLPEKFREEVKKFLENQIIPIVLVDRDMHSAPGGHYVSAGVRSERWRVKTIQNFPPHVGRPIIREVGLGKDGGHRLVIGFTNVDLETEVLGRFPKQDPITLLIDADHAFSTHLEANVKPYGDINYGKTSSKKNRQQRRPTTSVK